MTDKKDNIENLVDMAVDQEHSEKTDDSPVCYETNQDLRIKSPKEVAQTELFAIPPTVDIETVNENMNEQYALAKKQKLKEEKDSALEIEKINAEKLKLDLNNQSEVSVTNSSTSVDSANNNVEQSSLLKKKFQEKIDFTNIASTLYNADETDNSRNYKKLFNKLIKKTEETTEPFKLEQQPEGTIEKTDENSSNEMPTPVSENDSTEIIDGSADKPDSDKISKRVYSPRTAIDDTNNFTYINKLLFATLATVCLICLIETGIMYFVINKLNPIHKIYYFIAALIALIPLGVGLFKYAINPKRTIKKKFSYSLYFLNSIIVVVILLVILLVVALLSSISLVDPTDYVPKILLPCLYIANYPIGVLIFMLYQKAKLFNIKDKSELE